MKNNLRTRAWRRAKTLSKYITHLKRNLYWLWLDNSTGPNRQHIRPKNWKELDEGCKFAKQFKNGGNHDMYDFWTKKYRKDKAELKKGYPKDRIVDDDKDIEMSQGWFEDYCNACDHFETDECPFKDKVDYANNWKKEIRCNKFWN